MLEVFYNHKNASGNPRTALFNGIPGSEELDQVSEDF
jgi:hypothetical protein